MGVTIQLLEDDKSPIPTGIRKAYRTVLVERGIGSQKEVKICAFLSTGEMCILIIWSFPVTDGMQIGRNPCQLLIPAQLCTL